MPKPISVNLSKAKATNFIGLGERFCVIYIGLVSFGDNTTKKGHELLLIEHCHRLKIEKRGIESNATNTQITSSPFRLYFGIGWGVPVLFTLAWAIVTGHNVNTECWFGYSHTAFYWIVEGPRLALIIVSAKNREKK